MHLRCKVRTYGHQGPCNVLSDDVEIVIQLSLESIEWAKIETQRFSVTTRKV